MNKEVKKILEKEFDYDFKSEFYTDEILLMIEEVIKATTLQLLQTDVSISLVRAKKYARHQHFLGTQGKELVEFEDWKQD